MKKNFIAYDNQRISTYEVKYIKDMHIENNLNDHTTLNLTCVLDEQMKDKYVQDTDEETFIEVFYEKGKSHYSLINGIVTNIKVSIEGYVYMLFIEAKSFDYKMDLEKKKRDFQNINMTTHELIAEVMKAYPSADYNIFISNEPIGEFILQYNESDYEFLRRIVSRYNQCLISTMEFKEIHYEGNENTTLFYGVVTNIEIDVEREVYKINLEAKSMSYLMDIKIKSRSFQDISMTTHNLINLIMKDYKNSNYILNIPDEEVKDLLIQFEETDWEFLKRIASKYNQGLFPIMDAKLIHYYMAIPNQDKELKTKSTNYKIYKDLDRYNYMLQNFLPDAGEIDYITYEIENHEVLKRGERL